MNYSDDKLIPITQLIAQAKAAGYVFGKGDPKNRLRYFTKLGLIPRAVRLRAGKHDAYTVGYYPTYTVHLLLQMQYLELQGKRIKEKGKRQSSFDLHPSSLSLAAAQRGALQDGELSSPLVTTSGNSRGHTTQERLHWAAANIPPSADMYAPVSRQPGTGTTEASPAIPINIRMNRIITHYFVPTTLLALFVLAINRSYIPTASPLPSPQAASPASTKLAEERQLKLGQPSLPEAARPQLASSSGPEGLVNTSDSNLRNEAIWLLTLLETTEPGFGGDFFPSESTIKLAPDIQKGKNLSEGICSLGMLPNSRAAGKTTVPSLSSLTLGCKTTAVSSGSGRFEAGQASVVITTPTASPASRILITPTTVTNQILAVVDKRTGSFTVSFPTPTKSPATFDWFIMQ